MSELSKAEKELRESNSEYLVEESKQAYLQALETNRRFRTQSLALLGISTTSVSLFGSRIEHFDAAVTFLFVCSLAALVWQFVWFYLIWKPYDSSYINVCFDDKGVWDKMIKAPKLAAQQEIITSWNIATAAERKESKANAVRFNCLLPSTAISPVLLAIAFIISNC